MPITELQQLDSLVETHLAGEVRDQVRGRGADVAIGRAHFVDLKPDEFVNYWLEQFTCPAEVSAALGDSHSRPGSIVEGEARSRSGPVDVGVCCERDAPDRLFSNG
jgi:hypothetical protein